MKKSFTIHDLPKEERPRERLENFGAQALSAQELLSLILGRGVRGESVMMTSQKILSRFGSLGALQEASLEDLKEIHGLGSAKAAQIKACLEIARRMNNSDGTNKSSKRIKKIVSANDVYKLIKPKLSDYNKEHFFVLSLGSRNNILGIDETSVGTLNANLVHPRETFEVSIRRHAAQVIVIHNHPTGEMTPSEEDEQVTIQLIAAGRVLDILVLDHIIISRDNYFSFANTKPALFKNE